jgi:DNA-binding MurR/RpiR family transcriptional regulator
MKTPLQRSTDPLDVERLIGERYASLPENQKKVADYLLHHLREAAFLSVVDIERGCGASKATVVRFAQRLGFSGFLELRARLIEGVQSQLTVAERFPLVARADRGETLTAVARQDVENINATINGLDRAVFAAVVERLLGAAHVYTVGVGISSLMAKILAYSLNQVAIPATPFDPEYRTFVEQLAFVQPADVLVGISFPPYSRDTVDILRRAEERKIAVIAVTDRITSPLARAATAVLPIRSQNMLFTNSFSALSVLINALATELALRNKTRAIRLLKEIERQLEETGHYYTP